MPRTVNRIKELLLDKLDSIQGADGKPFTSAPVYQLLESCGVGEGELGIAASALESLVEDGKARFAVVGIVEGSPTCIAISHREYSRLVSKGCKQPLLLVDIRRAQQKSKEEN